MQEEIARKQVEDMERRFQIEDMERRFQIVRKATRLDIAARLLAADVTNGTGLHSESPSQEQRRRYALEQADRLIEENEARP